MTEKKKQGQLVPYNYGADANKGWENTDTGPGGDFAIPFLNQLQALSQEVQEGDDSFVPGAKPGALINSVTKQLYGDEIIIVPCLTQHDVVEWSPRDQGGGFVAVHDVQSAVVRDAKDANGNRLIGLRTPEGNELVDTYTIYALRLNTVDAEAASEILVIPFTKTKIKRYKGIMTQLRTMMGSSEIPLFAHRLRLVATRERNAANQTYFNVKLEPAIENDIMKSLISPKTGDVLLEQGRRLREDIGKGAAKAGYDSDTTSDGAESKDEVF